MQRHVREDHGHLMRGMLNYHVQGKHSEGKSICNECGHQAETAKLNERHKLTVHRK